MVMWMIAALFAGFIKGLCAVGDAPIFSAIMSFSQNNIDISPVNLITTIPPNIYLTWKNRKSLRARIWVPMALMLTVGAIPGTLLLKNANTDTLKMIFAVFIMIIGIIMLTNEIHHKKIKPSRLLLIITGILAGLGSGLFSVGILIVIYISMTTDDMSSFKGNICATFLADNIVRFVMYSILGIITINVLKRAAICIPFSLMGVWLGEKAATHLDDHKARMAAMSMMIVSGIAIIIANL